jgi:predicted phosphodiesterase
MIFFAGDLCVFGARPKECLELLRDENIMGVHGNTDQWISNRPILSDDIPAEKLKRARLVNDIIDWTSAALGEMDRAYLSAIPFHRRVSPTVYPQDDLFIVHANPIDVDQPIHPPESLQQTLYGEIKQPDNDAALRHLLSELETGVMAYGHIHIPSVRQWGSIKLANISSVSLPLDGDSRAKYGLLTWEEGAGWNISHHYVDYNVGQEKQLLSQLKPPDWESLSKRLDR